VKGTTLTSKISLIQIPPTGALSLENIRTATCRKIRNDKKIVLGNIKIKINLSINWHIAVKFSWYDNLLVDLVG
jgi:hypothetical protein